MEVPEGLEIRESPIHGLGVFATKDFPVGYCFGEFIGEEMPWRDFTARYGKDFRYCYKMRRIHRVINAKEKRNWITFINEGKPNVILRKRFCFSLRPLKAGEELLLDYGYYPTHT